MEILPRAHTTGLAPRHAKRDYVGGEFRLLPFLTASTCDVTHALCGKIGNGAEARGSLLDRQGAAMRAQSMRADLATGHSLVWSCTAEQQRRTRAALPRLATHAEK